MSGVTRQLLRIWRSNPLPTLKQGGTLTIRSKVPNTVVSIQPEWRDDGDVSLIQQFSKTCTDPEAKLSIQLEDNKHTSLGRAEAHVSLLLDPSETTFFEADEGTSSATSKMKKDTPKRVILEDGTILPDSQKWDPPPSGTKRVEYHDGMAQIIADADEDDYEDNFGEAPPDGHSSATLAMKVPEKINLECMLLKGGSIHIGNKVEGDVLLKTTDGTIQVKKLRGHSIHLEALGQDSNAIYASGLLEAQTLNVNLPSSNSRLRAKRIHASSVEVLIGDGNTGAETSASPDTVLDTFDDDDTGASCDISSIYLSSGQASVKVHSKRHDRRAVRIKSNHGPIVIEANGQIPTVSDPMKGNILPLVELGGVNGSCEVTINTADCDKTEQRQEQKNAPWTACQAHFDSLSPDTVSMVHTDRGDVTLTVDRKVEADMRLLSAPNAADLDIDSLLADQSGDPEILDALEKLNNVATTDIAASNSEIRMKTKAFITEGDSPQFSNLDYLAGHIDNKSGEPDSRFDRKIRGGGKIQLDGAAAQALQRFGAQAATGGQNNSKDDDFLRPLVAVVTPGSIVVETLSWLGNIARRYGLEDTGKDPKDMGRTATRRGRDFVDNE